MNIILFVYLMVLFVALSPGVLVTLSPAYSKYVVVLTHAVIFATVWNLTHTSVWLATETFQA